MKEIILNRGFVALVDDRDYEYINSFKWTMQKNKNNLYAARVERIGANNSRFIKMHRVIMNVSDPKIFIDHADKNGLNNQRSNLRIATCSQNSANRRLPKGKYLGVNKVRENSYQYEIRKEGVIYKRNGFKTALLAAIGYNEMAVKLFGEFATLNQTSSPI